MSKKSLIYHKKRKINIMNFEVLPVMIRLESFQIPAHRFHFLLQGLNLLILLIQLQQGLFQQLQRFTVFTL